MSQHLLPALLHLPDELLVRVFAFIDARDLAMVMRTCRQTHDLVAEDEELWDALASSKFATPAPPSGDEEESLTSLFQQTSISGSVDSAAERAASMFRLAAESRSPPSGRKLTVKGGMRNFADLQRIYHALSTQLICLEADISNLPFEVDVIAVPSNEYLQNPGFGALLSIFRRAGPELERHIRERTGPQFATLFKPGDVITTPAFGQLKAKHLCHAVGINWHGVAGAAELREQKCREQAQMIESIFDHALQQGARTIAIPGISSGARRFPAELVALLTLGVAKRKVIESGLALTVFFVSYGPVSLHAEFLRAREAALSPLVT